MTAWEHIVTDTYPVPVTGVGAQRGAFGQLLVEGLMPKAGWTFPYNEVNTRIAKPSVSGTGAGITVVNGMARIASGTDANGTAVLTTRRALRYMNGVGGRGIIAGIFSPGVANSTQLLGIGDAADGLFFGFNGAQFGILRRSAGVDYWTLQSAWDVNPNSWTTPFDPTKGNVYGISYQWLGFGEIRFFIEDPETGTLRQVYRIQWANANTTTSIRNPQLPMHASSTNTGNTTSLVVQSASAMGFHEGEISSTLEVPHAVQASRNGVTTAAVVLALRNDSTHNGVTNRTRVHIVGLSMYAEGNGSNVVNWRMRLNSTLTGTTYTAVHTTNSVCSADVTGGATQTVEGELVWSQRRGRNTGDWLDVEHLNVFLAPGDVMTLEVESASTVNASASMQIHEEW